MSADARAAIDLSLLTERGLQRGLQRGMPGVSRPAEWRLDTFAGRLGEISAGRSSAALTLAFRLVLEAQRRGEPVVWISRPESIFFPPDVAGVGVDLGALPVIRVSRTILAARAADRLVRSGAFGLVVLDIGARGRLSFPVQSRLGGLAKKHDTALLCLTEKENDQPSLGSLVSVRAEARRSQKKPGERFRCEARVLKDKRRGPGWTHVELFRGPDGLR
jgi:recombination protein RecA